MIRVWVQNKSVGRSILVVIDQNPLVGFVIRAFWNILPVALKFKQFWQKKEICPGTAYSLGSWFTKDVISRIYEQSQLSQLVCKC